MSIGFANVQALDETGRYTLLHCVPVNDIDQHRLSPGCKCRPVEDNECPDYWMHNAFDDRESYFEHGRKTH